MTLNAFKNGVTTLDEATMNAILAAQPSSIIFDGTQADAKTGTGAADSDLSIFTYYARFTLTGQTTIGRIELELIKYGNGADLTVEIRDNSFNPNGSNNGVLIKSFTFPAKLFQTAAGYISLPIDLSGLTSGAQYWVVLKKAGDSTNRIAWRGETTADANYPTYYRSGSTGAWTAGNALHFKIFANTSGTYILKHGIYGTNAKTLVNYDANGNITEIWRWLPASDGTFMICDKLIPTYDANGVPVRWEVQ
ncbi:choice-of-anchor R domain-containing protein [Effusibacillus dendaii]|uniref:Uncharacterized protein n=1 Tax=Effusibacillus dendaii TaxID=2743772 RepID=A0A7I8D8J3_9BACL|nr:choice-of-anchor R domain-containing protein [Effusibacillus dendaii]BCJ86444.1 hypothetical protein skT53_14290 [Effusibacillus dendaii]